MSIYKHLLVGLDLSPESQQVVDRVKLLFADSDIKISICHILEPLAFTYGGDIPVDLSDVQIQLENRHRTGSPPLPNSLMSLRKINMLCSANRLRRCIVLPLRMRLT